MVLSEDLGVNALVLARGNELLRHLEKRIRSEQDAEGKGFMSTWLAGSVCERDGLHLLESGTGIDCSW